MANKKISELPSVDSYMASSYGEIVEGGINKKFTPSDSNPFRGDYSGTTTMPVIGGRFTGGIPAAGDRWRLTATLSIGGNVYAAGTIIEAMINTPGDTLTNWAFYAVQL